VDESIEVALLAGGAMFVVGVFVAVVQSLIKSRRRRLAGDDTFGIAAGEPPPLPPLPQGPRPPFDTPRAFNAAAGLDPWPDDIGGSRTVETLGGAVGAMGPRIRFQSELRPVTRRNIPAARPVPTPLRFTRPVRPREDDDDDLWTRRSLDLGTSRAPASPLDLFSSRESSPEPAAFEGRGGGFGGAGASASWDAPSAPEPSDTSSIDTSSNDTSSNDSGGQDP